MKTKSILLALSLSLANPINAVELSFYNYEKYDTLTSKLFKTYNIDSDTSSILQRNTAYYFKNYLKIDSVNSAISADKDQFLETIYQRNFWADKLERDISIPYSDKEVFSYFQSVQMELDHFVKYLKVVNVQNSDFSIYLYGSMAKGRFGANSSVDLRIESNDLGLLKAIEEGVYSKTNRNFRGNIEASTSLLSSRDILDPLVKVSIGDLSNLLEVYAKILKGMGFLLTSKDDSLSVDTSGNRQRIHMEFNPVEDRVFYLDKKASKVQKNIIDNFNMLIGKDESQDILSKNAFIARVSTLIEDYSEVQSDLETVSENRQDERYKVIESVIAKASFDRLKRGLAKKLLNHVKSKISSLKKLKSNL
ncbi:MAG: hypothetical protein KC646_11600 [Candidatus Cloacimonetes bacterium]|nr:hypothetical protein [Candidatus Cloacimonadota bacterium]